MKSEKDFFTEKRELTQPAIEKCYGNPINIDHDLNVIIKNKIKERLNKIKQERK